MKNTPYHPLFIYSSHTPNFENFNILLTKQVILSFIQFTFKNKLAGHMKQ